MISYKEYRMYRHTNTNIYIIYIYICTYRSIDMDMSTHRHIDISRNLSISVESMPRWTFAKLAGGTSEGRLRGGHNWWLGSKTMNNMLLLAI